MNGNEQIHMEIEICFVLIYLYADLTTQEYTILNDTLAKFV